MKAELTAAVMLPWPSARPVVADGNLAPAEVRRRRPADGAGIPVESIDRPQDKKAPLAETGPLPTGRPRTADPARSRPGENSVEHEREGTPAEAAADPRPRPLRRNCAPQPCRSR